MRGRRPGSRKRWYALMALAIFLHVLAMTNSDLGLDAHVRLNAAMDGQHDGQDLAWGKLRIADSLSRLPRMNRCTMATSHLGLNQNLLQNSRRLLVSSVWLAWRGFRLDGRALPTVQPHEAGLDSLQSNFLVCVGTWLRRRCSGLRGGIRNSWISFQSR